MKLATESESLHAKPSRPQAQALLHGFATDKPEVGLLLDKETRVFQNRQVLELGNPAKTQV